MSDVVVDTDLQVNMHIDLPDGHRATVSLTPTEAEALAELLLQEAAAVRQEAHNMPRLLN